MIVSWPPELPQTLRQSGFSQKYRDGLVRSRMEGGPGKLRRRFSSAVRPLAGTMLLDRGGLARLERFYDEDTAGGSLPFLMRDPVFDGMNTTLLTESGKPVALVKINLLLFAEPPSITPFGPNFMASLSLSIMP